MPLKSNQNQQRSQSRPQGRPGQSARVAKARQTSLEKMFAVTPGTREGSSLILLQPKYLHAVEQARSNPKEANISDLAESIVEMRKQSQGIDATGILQALLVEKIDDYKNAEGEPEAGHYKIIAGERRYRAAIQAGIPEVPCLAIAGNALTNAVVQLTENIQREDLDDLDEARALFLLQVEHGISIRDLAAMIGKDKGYVERRLKLQKVGLDVQNLLSRRRDSKGATLSNALLIDGVPEGTLREQMIKAAEGGASLRFLEKMVEADAARRRAADVSLSRSTIYTSSSPTTYSDRVSRPSYAQEANSISVHRTLEPESGSEAFAAPEVTGKPFAGGSILAGISVDPPPSSEPDASKSNGAIGTGAPGIDTVAKYIYPATQLLDEAWRLHENGQAIPIITEELARVIAPVEARIAALRKLCAEQDAREAAAEQEQNNTTQSVTEEGKEK